MGYARIADDVKARKELEQAYAGDPFDVRTTNQLNVLYDGVLKQMVLLPGESVDLRVHRKDRKALERTMLPFLQTAWQGLVKKYGFAPERPLQVEIFPEVEQFSVRTVGLPQLGAHAVCFGHLITSRSPVEHPFNWKMVLQHELSHVFHIQASDGRVPRWLTEGLAMMESVWAEPRWASHLERRAFARWKAGRMAPIDKFNLAFSQATSMQDIVDAYFQAALVVEFLNTRYGFEKLRALVAGYKSGQATPQLLQEHLGATAHAIDREFSAWLEKRLAKYSHDFHPNVADLARAMNLADKGDEEPDPRASEDANAARAALITAIQHLRTGRPGQALASFKQVLALANLAGQTVDPQDLCTARFFLMELAMQGGDRDEAGRLAEALVKEPGGRCDGVTQQLVLSSLSKRQGKLGESVQHVRKALELDAEDGPAMGVAAEIAALGFRQLETERKGGKTPAAQDWLGAISPGRKPSEVRALLRHVVRAEPNDPRPPALLAKMAWADFQAGVEPAETLADLNLAAQALEETDLAGSSAVLAEARLFVAKGRAEAAFGPYRMAAERAKTSANRAEAWCELAEVARKAAKADEAAEAKRHCDADRPPEPQVDRTAPKIVPQPPTGK